MKLPIVILALLGLVCGKPLPPGSLIDDLKEFVELFPTDKVLEIALDYLANDPEVKEFVVHIQSEEFPKIHTVVEHLKEYKDCLKFINDQGVDVYAFINEIHDILGLPPYQPTNTTRMGVGIRGLIDDVAAVLPLDDWAALLDKKMETGEFFKTLVPAIHPSVFMNMVDTVQKMVNTVRAWPEYHELLEILRETVVNVEHITKLLWEISLRETHSLQDDLHDFMALVPINKVISIALDYLSNDKELQEYFDYIHSEEFPKIHKIVEYIKEHTHCLKFINDQGVDVYAFINEIYDILGLPPFQPTNTTRMGVGIRGLVDDVIAVLPLDDLKALFDKKTETREYFKALVKAIHSPVFVKMVDTVQKRVQKIVDTVRSWPEYHELLQILREKDFDVNRIIKPIRQLYWRGIPRLQEELKEFMETTDKVLEIALDYLANDPEVREFIVYIQSEEFPKIHKIVEHLKEYKDCSKFINDQGVDVYAIINEIHYILERHPFQPTNTTRTGVGIYGLIDDVTAVLPLNDLRAVLGKKMESREFFKTLVTAIHSPVLMNVVNTVRTWPEYNEMIEILRVMVVDVERITELLWELSLRGTQSLRNDVKEFMALVPTNKVLEITMDYLANDPELQEIFAYIQSEKFPKIHKIVEYLKQYKYCLKFINDQGVDVYAFILEIQDILGLPQFEPTNTTRTGVGIYGLIDDVVAVLPLDDMKAFFKVKMETREYFKTLVTVLKSAIKSPVFAKMVEIVRALPEYQKLLETLQQMGVDVVRIIEHLRVQLGLPPL